MAAAPVLHYKFYSNSLSSPSLIFAMFQVASHPAAFGLHAHGQYMATNVYQNPAVKLPRNLARPPFVDISRDAIIAVAPELESVPTEYIRRGLRPKANMCVHLFDRMPHSN